MKRTHLAAALVAFVLTGPAFAGPITDKVLDATAIQALGGVDGAIPFAVINVSRDFKDKDWNDQVIADGIRQLVVDEFVNNSRFISMEDNPEIRDAVRDLVAATWFGKDTPLPDFGASAPDAPKQLMISARLTDFSKRRMSGFGFGMGSATTTISVTVELDFMVSGKTILQTSASGSAKTATEAALFQIAGDKITFDATTVGTAVRAAVRDAAALGFKALGV